jgi:hypothetical protein
MGFSLKSNSVRLFSSPICGGRCVSCLIISSKPNRTPFLRFRAKKPPDDLQNPFDFFTLLLELPFQLTAAS